jgi:S1-C subfamily serine protease
VEVLRGSEVKTITVSMADQEAVNGIVRVDVIGMSVRTLTPAIARSLGYRDIRGVVVVAVDGGGRAANATPSPFQEGDIIVGLKGDEIKDADSFARFAESMDYNRGATFQVIRDSERGQLLIRD